MNIRDAVEVYDANVPTRISTAEVFAHNAASVALFEGFETWTHYPNVAELDGVGRDLLALGLRSDG